MKQTPLIKRFLFYVGLSLICFLMTIALGGVFRESNIKIFVIFVFLIPHYVFGLIFLKTKLIFKLIAPFITAIGSFSVLWFMGQAGFFDIVNTTITYLIMFLIVIIFWEIVYQILIRIKMFPIS
jgi:hypothetical protein